MTAPTGDPTVGRTGAAGGERDPGGIDRRDFVKTALLVGGTSALASLGSIGIVPRIGSASEGEGSPSVADRNNRQHAWDDYEATAPTGNSVQPANSLFLDMDYAGEGTPSGGERAQVEAALERLEAAFEWSAEGVLFTLAYSGTYFERYEEDPPEGAAPTPPGEVAELSEAVTTDDEVTPDDSEAVLLMASDNSANLLAAEEALWEGGEVNGVAFEGGFDGVFTRPTSWPDRRVGFAGPALPRERYNEEISDGSWEVPDGAPLSMGFVAGFDSSIPSEDEVALREGQRFPGPGIDEEDVPTDKEYVGEVGERDPGMFAQGTLKHLSYVDIDLDGWYTENDLSERRHQIYSPYHTDDETGEIGKGITTDPGEDPGAEREVADDDVPDLKARAAGKRDVAETTPETAAEGTELTDGEAIVGHSQKSARARYDLDGDGHLEQPVLRRDWDGIAPGERPGYHFNVPMRYNESIFTLLEANYQVEFESLDGRIDHEAPDTDEWRADNGIASYLSAAFRTNYLVPPITLRALPPARATRLDDGYTVESGAEGSMIVVRLTPEDGFDPRDLDFEGGTVRLGAADEVNRGGGAVVDPDAVTETPSGNVILRVPVEDTSLVGGQPVRLFGKTTPEAGREPVRATATAEGEEEEEEEDEGRGRDDEGDDEGRGPPTRGPFSWARPGD